MLSRKRGAVARKIVLPQQEAHTSGAQTVLSTGSARKTAFTRGSATAASTLSFPPCFHGVLHLALDAQQRNQQTPTLQGRVGQGECEAVHIGCCDSTNTCAGQRE